MPSLTSKHTETDADIGLYVHFPYCVQKCPYCDFNSHAVKGHKDYSRYTQAVLAELRARASELEHGRLHSIFFGGGTPSMWDAQAIATIIDEAKRLFPSRNEDAEIT